MKKLIWVGNSKKDIMRFPKEVMQEMGYALYQAQLGEKYRKAKPLKGLGSGVYEIAIAYEKNAYRSIYLLSLKEEIYVLHCFQKKSKQGIKTPKEDIELVRKRIKLIT